MWLFLRSGLDLASWRVVVPCVWRTATQAVPSHLAFQFLSNSPHLFCFLFQAEASPTKKAVIELCAGLSPVTSPCDGCPLIAECIVQIVFICKFLL
jgi:hypothetical protein